VSGNAAREADASRCYLCGSERRAAPRRIEGYRIVFCADCGLGETQGGDDAAYDAAYLESLWTGADPSPGQVEQAVRAELPRVRRIERAATGRRLLEVGAGHGYFLAATRQRGFDVRGLDVSSAAEEFCASRFGLDVQVAALENADLPQEAFDVVAAWHVLEHLADPRAALGKLASWLASAGILAVEVPNCESYDARVMGDKWVGWQPKYHRWHFTPRALLRLLDEAGFEIERRWSPPSRVARERLKRIPIIGLARPLLCRFYSSTGFAVIGRKRPAAQS
jgi:2-polyprenyl-3-methyl-5-hydroxy-6-metoxy-1,4-benzoquinol methylase